MYNTKRKKNRNRELDNQRDAHPTTVLPNNSQGAQRSDTTETIPNNKHNSNRPNERNPSKQTKRNKKNKHIKRVYPDEIEMRYQMSTVPNSDPPTPPKIFTAVSQPDPTPELTTYGGIKLGWVQGVLIPCLLNIWGVMLFLRIAWIVAQAGIGCSILIIFMSAVVCIITTLSLSAICTNGQLQGGGVYYLVSRSLGAELGASVGIIFAFANAVAASMNTIGFCESFNELLKSHNVKIIDNSVNDIRIVGTIALLMMCLICAVGMDWETRTQNFLIVIIVTAIINYVIGSLMGPMSDRVKAEGFQGLNLELASSNWAPDFRITDDQEHGFFSVFAMYFPAVTGVQAGANICGDLRDPATAIPKGTLLAVVISTTSYVTMVVLSGMGALRDASGNITLAHNIDALSACKPNCQYGLHNNYEIMHLMALWGPLIYGGCWAATLSTALTNLLSVPRLIQALGIDRIYPGLIYFSKPYGKHGEPYRGYVLVFLVSLLFLLIADLNTIAPLITNFYLASYALINFCTFHAAFFKPITWRPGFRYFNLWLSLVGCLLCITIMIIISWMMALITTFIFLFLYLVVLYRQPETSWEGSTNAQRYQDTIAKILQIYHRSVKTSSYNPQLLVLAGEPQTREWLLDMGKLITSIGSFMIVGDIEPKNISPKERHKRIDMAEEWLRNHKLRAFYILIQSFNYEQGVMALLQTSGLGRLAPNILLIGYKYNWREVSHESVASYFHSLQLAFEFNMAVTVLRVPRVSRALRRSVSKEYTDDVELNEPTPMPKRLLSIMPEDSDTEFNLTNGNLDEREPLTTSTQSTEDTSPQALSELVTFKRFIFPANSTLDAWWLYDDGGINILLPYIIARRSSKDKLALRVFILPKTGVSPQESYNYMKNLLTKFRIEYSKLTLVEGINSEPSQSTLDLFKSFTSNMTEEDKDIEHKLLMKTTRHLRLRELMMEHSFGADLIVMTLPYPRNSLSSILYMAWLEIMSQDLPPLLFVRGNHTSVIDI